MLVVPFANATYEKSERVNILSTDVKNNNLVIQFKNNDAKWLIHYNGNCDQIEGKQTTILSIKNDLDVNGDYLKSGTYYKCKIDQAEKITGMLFVDNVRASNTIAFVSENNGNKYEVYYDYRCAGIRGYKGKNIYYRKNKNMLSAGDEVFLPGDDYQCKLNYVDLLTPLPDVISTECDTKRPNAVEDVKASSGDGSVFLQWDEGVDNIGISHYIVSYSTSKISDPNRHAPEDMPNLIEVDGTSHEVKNLKNKRRYYFYILAVDTSGNMSSLWSNEVSSIPNSSVKRTDLSKVINKVNLRKTHESSKSFLFRWAKITSYQRQVVILEVDGEKKFISYNWPRNHIRILKKSNRRGKNLKLIIKEYNIKGSLFKDEFEFEF